MGRVRVKLALTEEHRKPLRCLLDDTLLRTFHGESMQIGPWAGNIERILKIPLDASGSPLSVGKRVCAIVNQHFDGKRIRNSLRLDGLGNLLRVESTWHVTDGGRHLVGDAQTRVGLPPPFKWIVEKFVDVRAEKQMQEFVTHFKTYKKMN